MPIASWIAANWKLALGLLVGVGLFFAGWHARGVVAGRELDALKLAESQAVAAQLASNATREKAYVDQLTAADAQRTEDLAALAAARVVPPPHLVCHGAPAHSGPVPSVPAPAGPQPAAAGILSPAAGPGFDPTPGLTQRADQADDAVEACRDAMAKWPKETS